MTEPAAELVHLRVPTVYGAACDSDLWQDPEESPDLWPQSTSDRDKVTCEACRATFTAEPTGVSPLLEEINAARVEVHGGQHLIAQVMEAVGVDRPEHLLSAIADLCPTSERDEARVEVEHGRKEIAYLHEIIEEFKAAQPDPLVLSLPTVPEGAVALVGKETGARYTRYLLTASWQYRDGQVFPFGHLLGYEGALRVEMAPPRDPRTWPKLPDPPEDFSPLLGASGTVYQHSHDDEGVPVYQYVDDITGEKGRTYSFYALQYLDGPLTAVFDEPGGAR